MRVGVGKKHSIGTNASVQKPWQGFRAGRSRMRLLLNRLLGKAAHIIIVIITIIIIIVIIIIITIIFP